MARAALAILLVSSSIAPGGAADAPKPKKPKLEVRATPRMAFSPVNVFFTAELTGGDDVEEYYCPEVEWEWDDGSKSVQESDCPPYAPDTRIERRFTAEHQYGVAGSYNPKVTFRRTGRTFVTGSVRVTVRAGLGDPTQEFDN
jgi:hypothetical protein